MSSIENPSASLLCQQELNLAKELGIQSSAQKKSCMLDEKSADLSSDRGVQKHEKHKNGSESCRILSSQYDMEQSDFRSTQNGLYSLPRSLMSSPPFMDNKILDPNACEFLPYASSAVASPSAQHLHFMSVSPVLYPLPFMPPIFPCIPYNAEVSRSTFPCAYGFPPPSTGPICSPPNNTHLVHFQSPSLSKHSPPLWKEHISRTLLLSAVPVYLRESQLRRELEAWGPVRALELERQHEGLVFVHYYDLRHAREALRDIQNQHLLKQHLFRHQMQSQKASPYPLFNSDYHAGGPKQADNKICKDGFRVGNRGLIGGNVVWAQYSTSMTMVFPDAHNQGTLVVFNVDADMPVGELRAVFQKYGDVKDMRETPAKRRHKFVEFYDVRDAANAWAALNGLQVCGKHLKIKFSRPGGQQARRTGAQAEAGIGTNGIIHNHNMAIPLQPFGWNGEPFAASPTTFAWPNYTVYDAPPHTSHQQWHKFSEEQPLAMTYPSSLCGAPPPPGLMVVPKMSGSFPSRSTGSVAECTSKSLTPRCNGNGHGVGGRSNNSISKKGEASALRRGRNRFCNGNGTHVNLDISQMPERDGDCRFALGGRLAPREATLNGSTRSSSRDALFAFDEREVNSNLESPRTTLMIRNIPNKYSQSMLLLLLDQHCMQCNKEDNDEPKSAYDFVYLPIDFKNRCNLGYAFVNFTTAQATLRFYKALHGQAWEAFNSRKVCRIAYARVQGRAALEEHFRNSRFACDTDEYLPLVFMPPRNGTDCPLPRIAAGQLNGKMPGTSVNSCRSPSHSHHLHDQGAQNCENGSFDGAGLGLLASSANVTLVGA